MRNHVVEKVLRLIRRKEKYLVVAAVRFLRTCISLKVASVRTVSCLHALCVDWKKSFHLCVNLFFVCCIFLHTWSSMGYSIIRSEVY